MINTIKNQLASHSILGPFGALVFAILFFSTQSPIFLTPHNLSLILQQVMVLGVLAIGQTLIILTAGIDLSCGMIMVIGSIVMAKLVAVSGWPVWMAVSCGIVISSFIAMGNGLLVTKIKLPPFIVTLGMSNIAFAMNQLYSEAQTVTNLPSNLTFLGERINFFDGYINYGVFLFLFLFLLMGFALKYTAPGRHIYAIGNNIEAVRLAGINTTRLLVGVYTVAGFFYGVAGWLAISRSGVGDPQAGQTENLDSITAVVLGGVSLFGGRGSLFGTFIGILIIGCMRNGLILMGVPSVMQILITGVLVILAVTIDSSRRQS